VKVWKLNYGKCKAFGNQSKLRKESTEKQRYLGKEKGAYLNLRCP
jgi:hypothetical protein